MAWHTDDEMNKVLVLSILLYDLIQKKRSFAAKSQFFGQNGPKTKPKES